MSRFVSGEEKEDPFLIILALLLTPISIMVNGVLLKTMWGWFLVPLGLSQIGTAHALGIAILVGMITHQHHGEKRSIGNVLFSMFFNPLFYFILAAIFHSCMR